jgi:hypothetical protein
VKKLIVASVLLATLCVPALADRDDGNRWSDAGRRDHGVRGAPGPIAGAGLPILAVGYGVYWLVPAPASPSEIPKMTSSNPVTILDSTFDRDGTKVMFGTERFYRVFEFAATATGVVLLAPIFLMAAIAIKLNSRGPIFIRDSQLGPNNRVIEVFKFRIATTAAKRGIRQRTNRIGLVLDGTGVDHLPQFFNVLRSELSLADVLRAIRRDGVFLP